MALKQKVINILVSSIWLIALAASGYLIYFIIMDTLPPPPPPNPTENLFIYKHQKDIEIMKSMSNFKDCKVLYKNISSSMKEDIINSFIDDNQFNSLDKALNSTYIELFIAITNHYFEQPEWKTEDLTFFRGELQTLWRPNFIERGSPIDIQFAEIQAVFNKYDEIVRFINDSKRFSFSGYTLSDRFPISDVKNIISRAATYRNNNLENSYVNNCVRLHTGLKEIPQALFEAHLRYLKNKISRWTGFYSYYNSQNDYINIFLQPFTDEIDALNNNTYNVSNLERERQSLIDRLNADRENSIRYFNSRRN